MMLTPDELARSSAQLYRDVLLTVIRYGDNTTAPEAVEAAKEMVNGYASRFGPPEVPAEDAGGSSWDVAYTDVCGALPLQDLVKELHKRGYAALPIEELAEQERLIKTLKEQLAEALRGRWFG